ncbi:MAG TPA: deoxyribodipyrimidine photo-lyase, partial [Rhizomicrobium sp.]|nr:deoxyribodipyrimidine photo-lyase [Rhizomicrobium sp.]
MFRQDLRLSDNPALTAALAGHAVIAVYVLDDETAGRHRLGGASRWWLHHSLAALTRDIEKRGGRLILRRGKKEDAVLRLVEETNAQAVFWNKSYEPFARDGEMRLQTTLQAKGVAAHSFNASLLFDPGTVMTKSGQAFSVFTPFWRACLATSPPAVPLPAPKKLSPPGAMPDSDLLADWQLLPTTPDWAGGLRANWTPGEAGAQKQLEDFIDGALPSYIRAQNEPAMASTSRLSPYLHFGEISPRQVWHAIDAAQHESPAIGKAVEKYLSELGWREFSYNLLYVHPDLPDRSLRQEFEKFQWRHDAAALKAWQTGVTGYPIVDAGMRQLWQTGWMHNRVRMITASFLIKHLLVDWRQGERWFWDTLVDADLASNSASWQWVAGSGADAAPYFRIFNPTLQGERFDPAGAYVKRWVPELEGLPTKLIHAPWRASDGELKAAGVVLGKTYPRPIVDHQAARARALAAFAAL